MGGCDFYGGSPGPRPGRFLLSGAVERAERKRYQKSLAELRARRRERRFAPVISGSVYLGNDLLTREPPTIWKEIEVEFPRRLFRKSRVSHFFHHCRKAPGQSPGAFPREGKMMVTCGPQRTYSESAPPSCWNSRTHCRTRRRPSRRCRSERCRHPHRR